MAMLNNQRVYNHITKVITSLVERAELRQLLESSAVGRPAAEINALVIRRDAGTGEASKGAGWLVGISWATTTLHLSIYLCYLILSYPILSIYIYISKLIWKKSTKQKTNEMVLT